MEKQLSSPLSVMREAAGLDLHESAPALQPVETYRRSEIERDPELLLEYEFIRDQTIQFAGAVGCNELQEDIQNNLIDGLLVEPGYFGLLEAIQPGIVLNIALLNSSETIGRTANKMCTDLDRLQKDLQELHNQLKPAATLVEYCDKISNALNPVNILKSIKRNVMQRPYSTV